MNGPAQRRAIEIGVPGLQGRIEAQHDLCHFEIAVKCRAQCRGVAWCWPTASTGRPLSSISRTTAVSLLRAACASLATIKIRKAIDYTRMFAPERMHRRFITQPTGCDQPQRLRAAIKQRLRTSS